MEGYRYKLKVLDKNSELIEQERVYVKFKFLIGFRGCVIDAYTENESIIYHEDSMIARLRHEGGLKEFKKIEISERDANHMVLLGRAFLHSKESLIHSSEGLVMLIEENFGFKT